VYFFRDFVEMTLRQLRHTVGGSRRDFSYITLLAAAVLLPFRPATQSAQAGVVPGRRIAAGRAKTEVPADPLLLCRQYRKTAEPSSKLSRTRLPALSD